ncbi:MAG TPA: histidine phosphatase family protein [Anaerolineae bacterium]
MTTRVLLVRHGDTEASKGDRFTGAQDIPISKDGRIHASELATRLSRYPLDAIFASSMQRAMETAGFIARVHALEVTPVPDLREMNHGVWDGKTRGEVLQQYGAAQVAEYDRDPYHFAPPGGESGESVLRRAVPALQQILRQQANKTILIVAHKTTNRLLICKFIGLDPSQYRERLAQRPACLNVLDFPNENEAQLLLMNDISHYAMSDSSSFPYAV